MELNSSSTIPLFEQLKQLIKEQITNGIYKAGQKIDTEIEISDKYNVSRITVRRAVDELVREGILLKKQGKGTFVQESKLSRKIEHLISFSEACKANNMIPTSLVTKRQVITPDSKLINEMGNFKGDKVLFIQRIRLADNIPIMCENNYYPYDKYNFLMNESLDVSLYTLLKNKYKIDVAYSKDSYIDVLRSNTELSNLMNISIGEPLFLLHTKIYDNFNQLIHLGKQYIVGSRYRFYYDDM